MPDEIGNQNLKIPHSSQTGEQNYGRKLQQFCQNAILTSTFDKIRFLSPLKNTGVPEGMKNWWCYYSSKYLTCQKIGGAIQGLPILNLQILVVL